MELRRSGAPKEFLRWTLMVGSINSCATSSRSWPTVTYLFMLRKVSRRMKAKLTVSFGKMDQLMCSFGGSAGTMEVDPFSPPGSAPTAAGKRAAAALMTAAPERDDGVHDKKGKPKFRRGVTADALCAYCMTKRGNRGGTWSRACATRPVVSARDDALATCAPCARTTWRRPPRCRQPRRYLRPTWSSGARL